MSTHHSGWEEHNSFRNTIRVSNGLDPDQDQHFVGPDLWVQIVCKGYQQMTKVAAIKELVKHRSHTS